MAEFKTINYTRFECTKCLAVTVIEPGKLFDGVMNCNCKKKEEHNQIERLVESGAMDGFQKKQDEAIINEILEARDIMDNAEVSTDDRENLVEVAVDATIEAIKLLTVEEIKDMFTVVELRVLAKTVGIKGYHNMGEDKLVARLLEKAE
jgi:hypothetical protein